MKLFIKISIILLLIFNGAGAVYGGLNLIFYPDGSTIQLSVDWLKHTPFKDYLIPGIVLFIANGILSFTALTALFLKLKNYSLLVIGQGVVLTGWIIIQICLIRTVYFLHFILGSIGLILMLLGYLQLLQNKKLIT